MLIIPVLMTKTDRFFKLETYRYVAAT